MSKLDEEEDGLWQLLEAQVIRSAKEVKSVELSMIAWAFGNVCRGSQDWHWYVSH